jgi:hypothetical protein
MKLIGQDVLQNWHYMPMVYSMVKPWRDARRGSLAWRGDLRLTRVYGLGAEMELKSEIPIEAVIFGRIHV